MIIVILVILLSMAIRDISDIKDFVGIIFIILMYIISTILIFKNKLYAQFFSIIPPVYIIFESTKVKYQIFDAKYIGIVLFTFEIFLLVLMLLDSRKADF